MGPVFIGLTFLVQNWEISGMKYYNSFAPGGFNYSLKLVNFKLIQCWIF